MQWRVFFVSRENPLSVHLTLQEIPFFFFQSVSFIIAWSTEKAKSSAGNLILLRVCDVVEMLLSSQDKSSILC